LSTCGASFRPASVSASPAANADGGHRHVLGQQQEEEGGERGEQRHDDRQPPRQPGLLAEDGLRGQQRPGRRRRRLAAARHLELVEPQVARRDAHARGAQLRLAHVDPLRPDAQARGPDLRGLRAELLAELVEQAVAVLLLRGLGRRRLRHRVAGLRLHLEAALERPAEPDLARRAHGHAALGRLARGDLDPRRIEREAAGAVGLGRGEAHERRRVGLVRDGHVVARAQPPRHALGLDLGRDLLVGLDPEHERDDRGVGAVRLGVRDELDVPQARLRFGRARRMQMDLDVLLVGPARAERHEVGDGRRDRPPALGQPAQREHVVVDDLGLVADQREHALAAAGVDADGERLVLDGVLAGQAQGDGGQLLGLGLGGRRWRRRGGGGRRRRIGGQRRGSGRDRRLGLLGGRGLCGGLRRELRRDGLDEPRRLPAQVLAADAEVPVVLVLAAAALAGPHQSTFFAAFTRSR
jgi:hypothetical protein